MFISHNCKDFNSLEEIFNSQSFGQSATGPNNAIWSEARESQKYPKYPLTVAQKPRRHGVVVQC